MISFTIRQQILFWVMIAIGLLAILFVLKGILLPFVFAIFIAYLLNPLVTRLQQLGLNRLLATIFILLVFVVLFSLLLMIVVPIVSGQLVALVNALPGYVIKLKEFMISHGPAWLAPDIERVFSGSDQALANWLRTSLTGGLGASSGVQLLTSLWSGGLLLFNFFTLLFIVPVVSFYLLLDWNKMSRAIDDLLPRPYASTIRTLMSDINQVVDGFIHGQILVGFLLGSFYAFALSLIGLNNALLIGLVAGVLSFIPFVGTMTGFLIATITAFDQFWPDWLLIAGVIAIFVSGQVAEGNFLTPNIMGERVRLHPVWLIFALFVAGYLLGMTGLLMAVPIAAAIGVLVRFAIERYKQSTFYERPDAAELPATSRSDNDNLKPGV